MAYDYVLISGLADDSEAEKESDEPKQIAPSEAGNESDEPIQTAPTEAGKGSDEPIQTAPTEQDTEVLTEDTSVGAGVVNKSVDPEVSRPGTDQSTVSKKDKDKKVYNIC